ncbi:Uncharacterised protein [Raoultella ornithinolytica]|nr:Uncharacterised protein [Raoultella ornithinolytica]
MALLWIKNAAVTRRKMLQTSQFMELFRAGNRFRREVIVGFAKPFFLQLCKLAGFAHMVDKFGHVGQKLR